MSTLSIRAFEHSNLHSYEPTVLYLRVQAIHDYLKIIKPYSTEGVLYVVYLITERYISTIEVIYSPVIGRRIYLFFAFWVSATLPIRSESFLDYLVASFIGPTLG